MKKLCCVFNYPPLYRQSIYKKIDETFLTTFYFGDEVIDGQKSGIKKIDLSLFKNTPVVIKNKLLLGKILWRTPILLLPFKDYSVFIVTGDIPLSYIPFLIFCKLLGKKVYGWGHGIKSWEGKLKYLNMFFYKMLDGFFTYGEKGKQRLVELGLPESKFHVIYNSLSEGVDAETNKALKKDIYFKHFKNNHPVLIFIGRLTASKKIDWLLKAMSEHQKVGINYNLILIGDGETMDSLRELSVRLSLRDQIWLYGECYNEQELKYLIYNADLCVSPGNVGLTAIHCMEYGVPVITHDKFELQGPEYEAIIEDKTGKLYQYGNLEDMKQKIEYWLQCIYDRDTIRQYCYEVINTHYNSNYQIEVIKKVLG